MRILSAIVFIALILPSAVNAADADCVTPPGPVKTYLAAHPEWSMLRLEDFSSEQQDYWESEEGNKAFCPGFIVLNMDGRGTASYAAIVQRKGDRYRKVIFFRNAASKGHDVLGVNGPGYIGLYRAPPQRYQGFTGVLVLTHDGLAIRWSDWGRLCQLIGEKLACSRLAGR